MKPSVMLTITSLLSILLFMFHLADDIYPRDRTGGLENLIGGSLIMVVWLYGATVLAERRSGYVITLLGALLSFGVAILHMKGKGVGIASGIVRSSGGYRFVWMLIALGVTGLFSAILAARGLWSLPWRRGYRKKYKGALMREFVWLRSVRGVLDASAGQVGGPCQSIWEVELCSSSASSQRYCPAPRCSPPPILSARQQ